MDSHNNIGDQFEHVSCPICGNEQPELLSREGQFGLPAFVSICQNDGLVFLNPRWTKKRYFNFYTEEYDSYYRPSVFTKENEDQKYATVKRICSRLENLGLLNNCKSVLDIGAGMGWSLEWFKAQYGISELQAIEPSETCLGNLEKIGVKVVAKDIDAEWHTDKVDLIIMRHVLEHFMNPVTVLRKLRNALSENGIIYIAVPDMMHPKRSLTKHCFRTVHTFYFSEPTLLKIAQLSDLEPIKISSDGSELWGVFKSAADFSHDVNLLNVYQRQMRVIKIHKIKSRYLEILTGIKNFLKSILKK